MTSDPLAPGPLAIEVLGTPGSGKTSLVEALAARATSGGRPSVSAVSVYCEGSNVSAWAAAAPRVAPLVARELGRLSRSELRWVLRLEASPAILRRARGRGHDLLVLDQGPVYTMVRIMASPGVDTRRPPFHGWWERALQRWARDLDLLVMLDAPEDVLLSRIDGRSKWHELKGVASAAGRRALADERARYEMLAAQLQERGPVRLVRVDTSRLSPAAVSSQALTALGFSDAGSR